jgi:hypothetical protein
LEIKLWRRFFLNSKGGKMGLASFNRMRRLKAEAEKKKKKKKTGGDNAAAGNVPEKTPEEKEYLALTKLNINQLRSVAGKKYDVKNASRKKKAEILTEIKAVLFGVDKDPEDTEGVKDPDNVPE